MTVDPKIKSILNTVSPVGRDRSALQYRVVDEYTWRSYYSGADVRFEIEGIPIDEVAGISYKIVEPVRPHFGYASYVRLKTSRGSRTVQGQIVFNFKDPADLYYLLDKIKTGETPDSFIVNKPNKKDEATVNLVELIKKGQLSLEDAKKVITKTGTSTNPNLNTLFTNKPDVEIIDAFKNRIWGITSETKTEVNLGPSNSYRETRYSSKYNGFSLRMIYGEPDSNNGIYSQMPSIDKSRRQIGAVKLIKGVEITSEYQEISETGEPVRTIYEFVAADVI